MTIGNFPEHGEHGFQQRRTLREVIAELDDYIRTSVRNGRAVTFNMRNRLASLSGIAMKLVDDPSFDDLMDDFDDLK